MLLAVVAGCGESSGVSGGATVTVYAAAAACQEAQRALAEKRGQAGELRVRVRCLEPVERGGRLDLAAVGANARRATEDSSAVAYIEPPGPGARFSRTILEEAEIALIANRSTSTAMASVLTALRSWDGTDSPREVVLQEVG